MGAMTAIRASRAVVSCAVISVFTARVPVSLPMLASVASARVVICPGNVASNSTAAKAAALAGSAEALATARELAISFRCFRLMVLRWRLALGAGVGVGVGVGSAIVYWELGVR